ncbi:hypothetical protein GGU10DRAFT_256550, partial [Lentinula aff. detonsa]
DGSGYNRMAGAAAVLYEHGELRPEATIRYQLGPLSKNTMFDAEGVGILLGLNIIDKYVYEPNPRDTLICLDGRSAKEALRAQNTMSGKNIVDATLRLACQQAKENGREQIASVTWIPGHCGIPGNEKADEEAKKAAAGNVSSVNDLSSYLAKGPLPATASAIRQ